MFVKGGDALSGDLSSYPVARFGEEHRRACVGSGEGGGDSTETAVDNGHVGLMTLDYTTRSEHASKNLASASSAGATPEIEGYKIHVRDKVTDREAESRTTCLDLMMNVGVRVRCDVECIVNSVLFTLY